MSWPVTFANCGSVRRQSLERRLGYFEQVLGRGGILGGESSQRRTVARSGWRVFLRVLLAALVVLGGGEVFVRVFVGSPSPHIYDPLIGYSYQPNGELFQAKEGSTHLRFNALGLNDRDMAPRAGRCRVLVIGDSYTAALQVPREQNFTSVAERIDPALDVINGGRDGLFLGDMHKVTDRLAPAIQPDLVVYVISERAVDTDIALPDFDVQVDPRNGMVVDAVMKVEQQETLKRIFGPVLNRSALATRLAAQFKPMVVEAIAQLGSWRGVLALSGSKPEAIRDSRARPDDVRILEFVFRRMRARSPAALLYVNGLRYAPHHRASVAPTSTEAEMVARRAAQHADLLLRDTGAYLIEANADSKQPPFGFDNALLPGGHLNSVGHEAVGRALVDLVHDSIRKLGRNCSAP